MRYSLCVSKNSKVDKQKFKSCEKKFPVFLFFFFCFAVLSKPGCIVGVEGSIVGPIKLWRVHAIIVTGRGDRQSSHRRSCSKHNLPATNKRLLFSFQKAEKMLIIDQNKFTSSLFKTSKTMHAVTHTLCWGHTGEQLPQLEHPKKFRSGEEIFQKLTDNKKSA
jgi:hypothetical protein